VPELAQLIDKPPPLPQTSQPRKSANSQQQTDPKLTGIGGWLILVALGQIFGPIRLLVSIAQYYSTLDSNIIGKLPVTFAGEAVINFFVLVLSIYTTVLFFRKSKRFPRFFVYEILAAIFLVPLDAMWIAVAASMDRPVGGAIISDRAKRNRADDRGRHHRKRLDTLYLQV
jgi:Protein of unknown function (DUF2569)